ncbi:MAG TPA: glycerophosphodiester phosphodiesterase [Steroidobacteraceae bacterium]|nr:glycerophosphodiester phosphodiesterase [Steroidobacteraceae bacterium]
MTTFAKTGNFRTSLLLGAVMSVIVLSGAARADEGDDGGSRRGNAPAKPIVIGHRGASGYVPEHTLAAYFIAMQQGADYVEPDLVMTKDGVLVARHENEIGGTTNVADFPELAGRRTTKTIDGVAVTGWFTEDFTLAELKRLRARERIPQLRPGNTRFDDQFEVPAFDEVLSLVRAVDAQRAAAAKQLGRRKPSDIGLYPETKHPTYFDGLRLSMEEPLLKALARHAYDGRKAPVFIQSFEVSNLRDLRGKTQLPLIQLVNDGGAPYDFVAKGDPRTYADMVTPRGLAEIATYADGIGANKSLIIPRNPDGTLAPPSALVANAHAAGLAVHGWTFRAENSFLPKNFQTGSDPASLGDLAAEVVTFLNAGMDGLFTDQPDLGVLGRDAAVAGQAR